MLVTCTDPDAHWWEVYLNNEAVKGAIVCADDEQDFVRMIAVSDNSHISLDNPEFWHGINPTVTLKGDVQIYPRRPLSDVEKIYIKAHRGECNLEPKP